MPGSLSWAAAVAAGLLVELHGNIHSLVCKGCHACTPVTAETLAALRAEQALGCSCGEPGGLRFRVMLYEDADGACVDVQGGGAGGEIAPSWPPWTFLLITLHCTGKGAALAHEGRGASRLGECNRRAVSTAAHSPAAPQASASRPTASWTRWRRM